MQIKIDTLNGRGFLDYTSTVLSHSPIAIVRSLNAPSTCSAEMVLAGTALPIPARRARVTVASDNGSVLFTGYLATEPIRKYAGAGTAGPVHTVMLSAISDEWLLDRLGPAASGTGLSQDANQLLQQLTTRVQNGSGSLTVEAAGALRSTGVVASPDTASWSESARLAASAGYAGYRVLGGTVAVQPAGAVVHSFSDGDGTLDPAALQIASLRELANDVTVSGDIEPASYITEIFEGDGVTPQFVLSHAPFQSKQPSVLADEFEDAALSPARWVLNDPGGRLGLGGGGLVINGGNGSDGQTTLTALSSVEMGGTLFVELGGVMLGSGSEGVLGGFYSGGVTLPSCFAGFRVRQSVSDTGSQTSMVALIHGVEVGSTFPVVEGRVYTLRMRLHCPEMYRFAQSYYCMADGAVQGFGGAAPAEAAMHAVLEVVEEGTNADAVEPTVLYDSVRAGTTIAGSPAQCSFALVNASQMFCSVRSVRVERSGSVWVQSTLPDGSQITRRVGIAGEGVDCEVLYGTAAGTPGTVLFFATHVPVTGERVTMFYRGQRRAVARRADAASIASEAVGSEPGTSRWLGKVLSPPARTSVDCESAAQAVLAMATSRSAALAGRYQAINPAADIWPGDLLEVTSEDTSAALLVQGVTVTDGHAVPELLQYDVRFANDWATEWADGLGLRLSDAIAADVELPQTAASGPIAVLENLPRLSVPSLTGGALQVDTGVDPPMGGGFEVRRRDWVFGPGANGADLVLRSPTRRFAIPRSAQGERFYVRMFDGGTSPAYSRFSSAVFVHASKA